MGDYYLGEIRLFSYGNGKVPHGWHICDGSILQISQYQALYAILKTAYGGDGKTTFGLPDLRGRVPINAGQQPSGSRYVVGNNGGAETVPLQAGNLPIHTHQTYGSTQTATMAAAAGGDKYFAQPASVPNRPPPSPLPSTPNLYGPNPTQALAPSVVEPSGASAAHNNMQPFIALTYGIAMTGLFPSRA